MFVIDCIGFFATLFARIMWNGLYKQQQWQKVFAAVAGKISEAAPVTVSMALTAYSKGCFGHTICCSEKSISADSSCLSEPAHILSFIISDFKKVQ